MKQSLIYTLSLFLKANVRVKFKRQLLHSYEVFSELRGSKWVLYQPVTLTRAIWSLVPYECLPHLPEFHRERVWQQQRQQQQWGGGGRGGARRLHLRGVLGRLLQSLHVSPLQPHLLWTLSEDAGEEQPRQHTLPPLQDGHHTRLLPEGWANGHGGLPAALSSSALPRPHYQIMEGGGCSWPYSVAANVCKHHVACLAFQQIVRRTQL